MKEALVEVKKVRGKFRLVRQGTTTIARNKNDTPLDGGGRTNRASVSRQAGYINKALKDKGNG